MSGSSAPGLRVGSGPGLGPHATAFAPSERTLLLRRRAAQAPETPWLRFDGGRVWSVGEMRDQVAFVAHGLRQLGCRPGDRVGLLMRNRVEFVAGLLGALAADCVAVPLGARERAETLSGLLRAAMLRALLVDPEGMTALGELTPPVGLETVVGAGSEEWRPWGGVRVLGWAALTECGERAASALENELGSPDSAQPALIQFTSGTTGGPKGVVYSHHLLYMYSALSVDALGWSAGDVLMTPLPLYHAAALHHVAMGSLHVGGLGALRSSFSATRFWQHAAQDGANFAVLMGPMAAMIDERAEPRTDHPVREVFCTPPPPDRTGFERRFGVRVLWQTYGMTEIYPAPMRRDLDGEDPVTAVGYPAAWTEFGVVDERGRFLTAGERGELVFRPRLEGMMFEGYWNDRPRTAHALRGRVFHTGDIGYYDEDGLLHLIGRHADRIRRRGENISAQSIERVALLAPGVVEAAVYGVPSSLGEDDIKLDLTGDIGLDRLRAHLVDHLPDHMLPRYYERRDGFPKTGSERIIKGRLRDLPLDRAAVVDVETDPGAASWPAADAPPAGAAGWPAGAAGWPEAAETPR